MATLISARAAALALVAASCYSPHVQECSITCGAGGACPFEMTCRSDGFCHGDGTPLCAAGGPDGSIVIADARPGTPDARPGTPDARPGTPDARPGTPDARPGMPDARPPDAAAPDAGGGCVDSIVTVEGSTTEDSTFANLSLGAGGDEHITYIDEAALRLRHAYRLGGGAWSFETVAPAAAQLKGQALDADGGLHVAFTQISPTPQLTYAHRAPSGGWTVETIDDSAVGLDASVAVDALGVVHVVYWWNLTDLNYAVKLLPGADWIVMPITQDGVVGEHPSLALAPNGSMHVSYRIAGTRLDLGYASRPPLLPMWNAQDIDPGADNVGAYTSIAVDSQNTAHIAYSDLTREDLKYATVAPNGTRRLQVADPARFTGRFNSLAVDAAGGVHISYFDYGNQDLKYAYKPAGSSSFNLRTIDSAGNVGRHSSLAVDAAGLAHIAYIDDSHGDLKYAIVCH